MRLNVLDSLLSGNGKNATHRVFGGDSIDTVSNWNTFSFWPIGACKSQYRIGRKRNGAFRKVREPY